MLTNVKLTGADHERVSRVPLVLIDGSQTRVNVPFFRKTPTSSAFSQEVIGKLKGSMRLQVGPRD